MPQAKRTFYPSAEINGDLIHTTQTNFPANCPRLVMIPTASRGESSDDSDAAVDD